MNLPQILSVLKNEPLYCTSGYRETLLEIFTSHAEMSKEQFRHRRTGKAQSGSLLEVQQPEVVNGIARIPIGGPLGQNLGEFEKGAGCVDYDDICAEIAEADEDDEVHTIVLNFDTPGGMVTGLPECGNAILRAEKPIYAWTRGQMCSAGYWLASCCDGVFCTPSSTIGSIGVCCSFLDLSKMAEMQGIKVKVFGSGTYKGMAQPGTSLTAEQEIWMKNHIAKLANGFYEHVRLRRAGAVSDADMQGQTFKGDEAVEKGFADSVMENLDELEEFLTEGNE